MQLTLWTFLSTYKIRAIKKKKHNSDVKNSQVAPKKVEYNINNISSYADRNQLTLIQVRVHVRSNNEIVAGPLGAEVHYVLEEILDVSYFVRHAVDDFTKQPHLVALFLAYVSDANYGGDRLQCIRIYKTKDATRSR